MKKTKKNSKAAMSRHYVMYGFEEANPQNTAYLRISSSADEEVGMKITGVYSIVDDINDATVFPSENEQSKKGFGTPYQWAEFFADEEELQDWNFHPIPFSKAD